MVRTARARGGPRRWNGKTPSEWETGQSITTRFTVEAENARSEYVDLFSLLDCDLDWMAEALCRKTTIDFTARHGGKHDIRRGICKRCPVSEQCHERALETIEAVGVTAPHQMPGIWAGLDGVALMREERARRVVAL